MTQLTPQGGPTGENEGDDISENLSNIDHDTEDDE
jgi:hypothetical protein